MVQENEVLGRIRASIDNPLDLEAAGHALYDLLPLRRGNLFGDEVYRLAKAPDATTTYPRSVDVDFLDSLSTNEVKSDSSGKDTRYLPPNHKFSSNDVVVITLQPQGSGDFFGTSSLPTSDDAVSVEARVLNLGPTYLDVAVPVGAFEAAFGPAPNDYRSPGANAALRLRADRFVSSVPYQRMVAALSQMTNVPDRLKKPSTVEVGSETASRASGAAHENIHMDEVLREAILVTHAFVDPYSPVHRDPDSYDLEELVRILLRLFSDDICFSHRRTHSIIL
jgi:hypothetical protein